MRSRGRPRRRALWILAGLGLLFCFAVISLAFGARAIPPGTVLEALTANDGSVDHAIVTGVRMPRVLIAVTVGASLAVAGALMQALTRNPLAAPGILGVNAGAALVVVISVFMFGAVSLAEYIWSGFLGAGLAAGAVYALGSFGRGGLTPLKLTVAGAAIAVLCSSLTQGVLILNERTLDEMRFWLAGSVSGRTTDALLQVGPFALAGLIIAMALAKQINTFSLGEDIARGLGQNTTLVKGVAGSVVVLLAGSAVAVAGPIGFVGLAVPHIARGLIGTDHRWLLPFGAILGGVLLLFADIGARAVMFPQEAPVGVMTALIGAPFFIYLARRQMQRL